MILQPRVSRPLVLPAEALLPRVHLVGPARGGISPALAQALNAQVRLLAWEHPPTPSAVGLNEFVIVDLTVAHDVIDPRSVTALLDRTEVWLVVGATPVDPGWIDRARHARVRVIQVSGSGAGLGCDPLIAALLERYHAPTCEIDPSQLYAQEPALRHADRYVTILCAHPWLVRRPRDLANLAHATLRALKVDCLALGFTRIEHFIVYVRALAYEQLIGRGFQARDARRLSGFSDPSNMRRHVRRALGHRLA